MPVDNTIRIIAHRVPGQALLYCVEVSRLYTFELALKKARMTKIGDFVCREGHIPRITLNEDLNPYLFLITYLHEVAHLDVHDRGVRKARAHGTEWKAAFRKLMGPIMHEGVFPEPLLTPLKAHMHNPAASTFSDPVITKVLYQYNNDQRLTLFLHQLAEGSWFCFGGRWFRKGKRRRTRVECREIRSRACYLISEYVPVESAQPSLF